MDCLKDTKAYLSWMKGDKYMTLRLQDDRHYNRSRAVLSRRNIGSGRDENGDHYIGWPGLKHYKYIDAILHDYGENVYIFQDDNVYLWNSTTEGTSNNIDHFPQGSVAQGWPKKISEVFPGIPDGLDTAFLYYYNRKIHFVKGEYFYTWDRKQRRVKGPHRLNDYWKNVCSDYVCVMKSC